MLIFGDCTLAQRSDLRMWDPYSEFESTTLPNGLSVYACKWARPWQTIGFVVHSGARHDPIGLEGLSHYVEHLVSQNASIASKEIESFFGSHGGSVMFGSTGYSSTNYNFFVATKQDAVARALDIFGSMLIDAELQNSIEREREVIIQEFFRKYPAKVKVEFESREVKAVYGGTWRERFLSPLGFPESVRRITQSDLQAYYDANYTPANISVVCVGGMGLSELADILSSSPFGKAKRGQRRPLPAKETDAPLPFESGYIFKMSEFLRADVSTDAGAYLSMARIPGVVSSNAISGVRSVLAKVLFEEVREKRAWTYHIAAGFDDFGDMFGFFIDCGSIVPGALGEIAGVVNDCLSEVAEREDMLRNAQQEAVLNLWMQDPNGRQVRDGVMSDLESHQRIKTLVEIEEEITIVTAEDVSNVLKWLKPERRWTRISRP